MEFKKHHREYETIRYHAAKLGLKKVWWTEEQKQMLIAIYGKFGLWAIAKYIGKTKDQCVAMAKTLGLSKKQLIWAESKVKILEENFPKIGYKVLDLLPGFTQQQVKSKATELGLKIEQRGKKCLCVETGIIYKNATIAVESLGLKSKSALIACLNKKPHYNTVAGYHWEWVQDEE